MHFQTHPNFNRYIIKSNNFPTFIFKEFLASLTLFLNDIYNFYH